MFTIGDRVTYTPPFSLPKPVIVMSSTDGHGYVDIQFVDLGDFEEFCTMGISEVVSETNRIGRVPEFALSFSVPEHNEEMVVPPNVPIAPNTLDIPRNQLDNDISGSRRHRPSSRNRRRGAARLSRRQ